MKDSDSMLDSVKRRPWMIVTLALAAAALTSLFFVGCKDKGELPDSKEERVEQMGQRLPKTTDMAVVVGDLAEMRSSLETAKSSLGDAVPMSELLEEQAKNELGVDLLDEQSWKKAGIEPKGAMTLAILEQRPVFMTYVADKKKFEKHFTDQLKKSYGIEGMPKNKGKDPTVKILGSKDKKQIAWTYFGQMVIIGFPPSGNYDESKLGGLRDTVESLAKTKEDESLATTNGYENFRDAIAKDRPMAVYINTGKFLDDERMKELSKSLDSMSYEATTWVKDNVDGAGMGFDIDKKKATTQLWMGVNEESRKTLSKVLQPPKKAGFDNLATTNTLLGLRLSLDWDAFWKFYKDNLPKEDRKRLMKTLEDYGAMAKIDVEKEVLSKLSGNIGVYFYGLAIGNLSQLRQLGLMGAIPKMGLIVTLQFEDKASLDKAADKLVKGSSGAVVRRPLKLDDGSASKNIEVLAVKNVKTTPGRLYIKGDQLAFGTSALSEQSMQEYLSGTRSEGPLTKSDKLDLGKAFASDKVYNGLYLNMVRAESHLKPKLGAGIPQVNKVFDTIEEASLTGEVTDKGAFVTLTVDLEASKSSSSKKSDK